MKAKQTLRFMVSFALASAWFGTHCGSGFATGAQATSFWVKYGAQSIFLPIVSAVIMALVAYWEWSFCQTFKVYDYKAFSNQLFHPHERIFGRIYVVLFLGIMIMGVSAVFAGARVFAGGYVRNSICTGCDHHHCHYSAPDGVWFQDSNEFHGGAVGDSGRRYHSGDSLWHRRTGRPH